MTADEEKPAAADAAPRRMQFSLGTLLLLPVAVGCAMAVLFTKPPIVALLELTVIGLLLPVGLTGGIVYGKGYTRAFCIGAMFPAGALFLLCVVEYVGLFASPTADLSENSVFVFRCYFGGTWLAAIVSGCLCMGIRWFSIRPNAPEGSTHRYGWGRSIVILLLVLLVLSGPVIGRIGIFLGWWKADPPQASTRFPNGI